MLLLLLRMLWPLLRMLWLLLYLLWPPRLLLQLVGCLSVCLTG